jgi:hypothetical protein
MADIKHTLTPWHMDKNRGDCGEGRYLYSVLTNEEGRVIIDCFNSDVSTVYEEYDGDDCYRWDAQGEADISYALEAVNNHERLIQLVQELEKALRAVLDDDGLADVIAAVGEGEPPFMQQVRAALAGKKESDE